MKLYTILYMLFVVANGEKKINLEDIERDNLKAESKSKSDDLRTDDSKYSLQPETNQQYQQLSPGQYDVPPSLPTYVTPQPVQNIPQEEYRQPNKYSSNEFNYQQQENLQQYEIPPLQQYAQYQLSESAGLKNGPSSIYNQQPVYQPDNQFQSFQIKSLADKFVKDSGKDNFYIEIPMNQFLSYYPHVNLNSLNNPRAQPSYQELVQSQQISIPLYTPHLSQKQLIGHVKMAYILPQYASRQPSSIPTSVLHKLPKRPVYATFFPKKQIAPPSTVYEQQDQSYAQGKQFLYTQAYIAQPQRQHVSPVIYNQGNTLYTQATPPQPDFYARPPINVQDNFLHGQVNQYNIQPEQSYIRPVTEQQELPKQNLRQEESQSVSQNYVKTPDEPNTDFVPPQIAHQQKFKPDVTQLVPISSDQEEPQGAKEEQVVSSVPRSLLDTYIPSNLIVARDSARYQERPLQLENGFLPSKTNFIQYKKRKATQ